MIIAILTGSACSEPENQSESHREVQNEFRIPEFVPDVIQQDIDSRLYRDWALEEIHFKEPLSIGNAGQLRLFDSGLYVYDLADMNVKRYAFNGTMKAVYGSGRGQGPGEFMNIFSFWPFHNEAVWIVDSMRRTISHFGFIGNYMGSNTPDFFPARVAVLNGGRLVVLTYMESELFVLTDVHGMVKGRFSPIVDTPGSFHPALYDGHLFPYPEGGFVWAPRFASYIFVYDDNIQLTQSIRLIDGHEFPVSSLRNHPMHTTASELEQPHRTSAVSVSGDYIFVSVGVTQNDESFDVLDRYDKQSGKYLDSTEFPYRGSEYQVHNGIIYGKADTTVHAFRFRLSDAPP